MSEEERRRIAASGGGFVEGQGAITDKGAKDFKEGMGSIATTSKIGGFALIAEMFTKITDLGNNPFLNVIINFFSLFGTFFNAESAAAAQRLAEHLYTEDNVEIMQDLAKATQEATISVEDLTRSIIVWNTVFKTIAPGVDAVVEALEPWRTEFEWMRDNIPRTTFSVQAFNSEIATFQTLINNFRFPGSGSGDGDGGGDDDTWWDPFD